MNRKLSDYNLCQEHFGRNRAADWLILQTSGLNCDQQISQSITEVTFPILVLGEAWRATSTFPLTNSYISVWQTRLPKEVNDENLRLL